MVDRQTRAIGDADLVGALKAGQVKLVYQPKIALDSNRMIGVEALARWHHPELGPIPPSDFIPFAEDNDLIDLLTEWVVAAAAADWSRWRARGLTTNIAINVSAMNLARLEFPDMVAEACKAHGMACEYLTIELTESATQRTLDLLDTLTRFRIKKTGISLDDFGTGYSSLMQLQQLPFSEMKIDKSFVMQADGSKDGRIIVKAIIDLAHNLGLQVVAEGVETEPVRQLLLQLGCDAAQGYLFAKPIGATDLLKWAITWEERQNKALSPLMG